MLKEQAKVLTKITKIVDLIMIFAAFALAYAVRMEGGGLDDFTDYLWIMLVVLPCWHLLLTHYKIYESIRTTYIGKLLVSLVKVHLIGAIVVSSAIYFFEPKGYSRGLFLLFVIFTFFLLSINKICLKLFLESIRRRGYNFRNILIAGSPDRALPFARLVEEHAGWGLRVAGLAQLNAEFPFDDVTPYPVLGTLDELIPICRENTVDEVVFCLPPHSRVIVNDHLRNIENIGVTLRMVLDVADVHNSRRELSFFHGTVPILTFYSKAFDGNQLLYKRCLDIVGALVGLSITALLFPFIALAIKLDSPGPLFFGQLRIGENGRRFTCWKFRSMHLDAEERKKELLARNEMNGAIFKIKNDPRITRVGNFLRKTSLDELPQFWNVLRGEMSLVGTRPPTPDEVIHYEDWHHRRICIRPGVTGLWQVSGRNQITDFDEVVRLDLRYIDTWSIWQDIKILCRTVWVVFARNGSS